MNMSLRPPPEGNTDELRPPEWYEKVPFDYQDVRMSHLSKGLVYPIEEWVDCLGEVPDGDPKLLQRAFRGPNLVISGPAGAGKTYAAFAVCWHLCTHGYWREETRPGPGWGESGWRTCSFQYWPMPDYLMELRREENRRDENRTLAFAEKTSVLFLDDIGASRPTDWSMDQIYHILNYRRSNRLPVLATTNLESEPLREYLGEGIYSRLMDGSTQLELSDRNRRVDP